MRPTSGNAAANARAPSCPNSSSTPGSGRFAAPSVADDGEGAVVTRPRAEPLQARLDPRPVRRPRSKRAERARRQAGAPRVTLARATARTAADGSARLPAPVTVDAPARRDAPPARWRAGAGTRRRHGHDGAAAALAPLPSRSRLNPALTFDTLVPGRANQMARTAALHVAGAPGQMYNPLFIYGGVGLGKTHLIHAVGNALLADRPDARILYLHAEQFITDVVKNYQRKTFDELKAQVPLARPAADRRRPVLRRQGPHAGGVLQRLRGAARQDARTSS